jgi:DNA-binding PadR family transcriptional regulator
MSIQHAILGVLADGDRHGYELARVLADRIGGEPYNTGQVHQALEQLERAGWAASRTTVEAARPRRQFRITAAGRVEFLRWLARPVPPPRPARDEILLKVALLAERDRIAAAGLLDARKRDLVAQLGEQAAAHRARAGTQARWAMLTLDALRFRLEAELRWVDHCLAVLRPAVAAPGGERAEDPPPPLAGFARTPEARRCQY